MLKMNKYILFLAPILIGFIFSNCSPRYSFIEEKPSATPNKIQANFSLTLNNHDPKKSRQLEPRDVEEFLGIFAKPMPFKGSVVTQVERPHEPQLLVGLVAIAGGMFLIDFFYEVSERLARGMVDWLIARWEEKARETKKGGDYPKIPHSIIMIPDGRCFSIAPATKTNLQKSDLTIKLLVELMSQAAEKGLQIQILLEPRISCP